MSGGNWKEMFFAIEKGNFDLVHFHLQSGMDPNYQHPEVLCTPLVEAMQKRQPAIARLLLEKGADPGIRARMEGVDAFGAAEGSPELEQLLQDWQEGRLLRSRSLEPWELIDALERNALVFRSMLSGLDAAQVHWRPAPGKWSLLEVVYHLVDEEVEDFRRRVRHCLERPNTQPPSIDPEAWVTARNYQGQDFEAGLARFVKEREESVAWLRSLEQPDWSLGFEHEEAGFMGAGMFLANWVAHDCLHLRQAQSLVFGHLQRYADHPLYYAGNW